MTYGVYRVTGKRCYRGHEPGTIFPAIIDPTVEQRAVGRGDIRLLGRVEPGLAPGSYRLQPDWLDGPATAKRGACEGASLVSKEEDKWLTPS